MSDVTELVRAEVTEKQRSRDKKAENRTFLKSVQWRKGNHVSERVLCTLE